MRAVYGGEYAGNVRVDHCGAALAAVQPERARCSSAARAWLGLAGGQMAKLTLLCQRDGPLPIKVVTARAGSRRLQVRVRSCPGHASSASGLPWIHSMDIRRLLRRRVGRAEARAGHVRAGSRSLNTGET